MDRENLRIGNLFNYNGEVIKVETIYYDSVNMDLTDCEGIELDLLEPIKLTEEILLSIEGVVKHKTIKNLYILKDSHYTFNIEDGYWEQPCLDIMKNGVYLTCVENTHELQNTMFWLLKSELKIKSWS